MTVRINELYCDETAYFGKGPVAFFNLNLRTFLTGGFCAWEDPTRPPTGDSNTPRIAIIPLE